MIAALAPERTAPPEEIAASYLLGCDAGFVTGSDLPIEGGVIADVFAAACRLRADRPHRNRGRRRTAASHERNLP